MSEETQTTEIDAAKEAAQIAWKAAGTAIEEADKLGEEETEEGENE